MLERRHESESVTAATPFASTRFELRGFSDEEATGVKLTVCHEIGVIGDGLNPLKISHTGRDSSQAIIGIAAIVATPDACL